MSGTVVQSFAAAMQTVATAKCGAPAEGAWDATTLASASTRAPSQGSPTGSARSSRGRWADITDSDDEGVVFQTPSAASTQAAPARGGADRAGRPRTLRRAGAAWAAAHHSRARWADIEDSDNEEAAPVTPAAPVAQEAPAAEKPEVVADAAAEVATTQMMVCNIPCKFLEKDLIEAVHAIGFGDRFHSVHLPKRHGKTNVNVGYGFVNFVDSSDADAFALAFEGYKFPDTTSTKRCTVKAGCQGPRAAQ